LSLRVCVLCLCLCCAAGELYTNCGEGHQNLEVIALDALIPTHTLQLH
jgi:hypothetical protein